MYKYIKNYEGLYKISDDGIILGVRFGKEKNLKLSKDKDGYLRIGLLKDGKRKNFFIHRLVAENFLEKIEGKNIVNHKNGIKSDNRIENLEWCNQSENENHKYKKLGIIHHMKINNHRKGKSGILHGRGKKIGQFLNGKLIEMFFSSYEAQRKTGISQSNILYVCKDKRKSAGGFEWTFL